MNPSADKTDCPGTLWLVIPCFNDSARLARFLPALCEGLEGVPLRVAIVVVDDGSALSEREAVRELTARLGERFGVVLPALCLEQNEGKGGAILKGWEAAGNGAAWLGFVDADGAVPSNEVRRVAEMAAGGPENALFASRIRMRGRTVERRFIRHFSGRIFASLIGEWIDSGIYDSQCGLKLIPASAYRKIRPHLREKGFAFDVELLALLNFTGTPVTEVPVDWFDIPGSKVSLARDAWRMFGAVWRIKRRMDHSFQK